MVMVIRPKPEGQADLLQIDNALDSGNGPVQRTADRSEKPEKTKKSHQGNRKKNDPLNSLGFGFRAQDF